MNIQNKMNGKQSNMNVEQDTSDFLFLNIESLRLKEELNALTPDVH